MGQRISICCIVTYLLCSAVPIVAALPDDSTSDKDLHFLQGPRGHKGHRGKRAKKTKPSSINVSDAPLLLGNSQPPDNVGPGFNDHFENPGDGTFGSQKWSYSGNTPWYATSESGHPGILVIPPGSEIYLTDPGIYPPFTDFSFEFILKCRGTSIQEATGVSIGFPWAKLDIENGDVVGRFHDLSINLDANLVANTWCKIAITKTVKKTKTTIVYWFVPNQGLVQRKELADYYDPHDNYLSVKNGSTSDVYLDLVSMGIYRPSTP